MAVRLVIDLKYKEKWVSSIRKVLRKCKSSLQQTLEKVMSKHSRLSSLYYGVFSSAMAEEHFAVLHGRLKYQQNLKDKTRSGFILRRNIHRLEKGLIMNPRRDVFARDYIEETVDAYLVENSNHSSSDAEEIKWAQNVLSEYFSVVSAEAVIDVQRERFELGRSDGALSGDSVPYKRDFSLMDVSFEQLDKPVPRELVDKAIEIGAQSPSACNRQPFHFRIYDDKDLVQKVSSIPMGTKGFSHQFPMIVVVTGQLEAYFSERDRHLIYIDASLASMGLIYGLETLGLSSCVINWPEIAVKEKQISQLLGMPPEERTIFMIAVGWPDKEALVPFSQKKSLENLRSYNKK
jgi:nitroreductase